MCKNDKSEGVMQKKKKTFDEAICLKRKKYPFNNLYAHGTLIDNPANEEPIIVVVVSLSEIVSKLFL